MIWSERWSSGSTYVQNPPYFEGLEAKPSPIGDVIEHHMIDIGFMPARERGPKDIAQRQVANLPTAGAVAARMAQCPKCGEASLIRVEGCDQCTSCGYSRCG